MYRWRGGHSTANAHAREQQQQRPSVTTEDGARGGTTIDGELRAEQQVREVREEQRDIMSVLNDRPTTTEKQTVYLNDRIESLEKDGIQQLQVQLRDMDVKMTERGKQIDSRVEDHARRMEQRWASIEKSVTAQKKTITNNNNNEDARLAELRAATAKQIKDLTKKVDDAAKKGATPAGRAQPHAAEGQQRTAAEWPVVIGGFRQDTPGELLVQATWIFLRRMRVANDLMNSPADDREPQPIPGGKEEKYEGDFLFKLRICWRLVVMFSFRLWSGTVHSSVRYDNPSGKYNYKANSWCFTQLGRRRGRRGIGTGRRAPWQAKFNRNSPTDIQTRTRPRTSWCVGGA